MKDKKWFSSMKLTGCDNDNRILHDCELRPEQQVTRYVQQTILGLLWLSTYSHWPILRQICDLTINHYHMTLWRHYTKFCYLGWHYHFEEKVDNTTRWFVFSSLDQDHALCMCMLILTMLGQNTRLEDFRDGDGGRGDSYDCKRE